MRTAATETDGQEPPPAVRARGLVKRFGDAVAVDCLDLDVPRAGCFGVLGPNGAGKTTLMRMIACVSPPSEGSLSVLGVDTRGDRRALKRRLGVVPQGEQGQTLDGDLTVRENLTSFAAYHDLPRRLAGQRADELLGFAQLEDRAGASIEALSGGMQRRLLIARALVYDPELVVLDEPTTGLDPQARHLVWERLRSLKRQDKTLLITTHYMDEAAHLCDRLAILDRGRVVAEGSPRQLIDDHTAPRVVELLDADADPDVVLGLADGMIRDVERVSDRLLIYAADGDAVVARLGAAGIGHRGLTIRDATLEDVFLRLTGHALQD